MSLKHKKMLITGGAGFIGSNLAIRLNDLGADVTVADNFSKFCGANEYNLFPVAEKIKLIRADISAADLTHLIRDKEVVFHLAGQGGHAFSHKNPELDLAMNTQSSLHLLEACRAHNPAAKILFTSTRQVFGEPQYLPVDENHPIHPLDINGIHKHTAEEYFTIYNKIYGLKTCTLRLTNTYGPRQSIKNNQLGVVGWFLNRALLDETLTLVDGGEQKRDFSFVDDVVESLILCAISDTVWGDVFNLSGPQATLKELAEMIVSICDKGKLGFMQISTEEKKIQLREYCGTSQKLQDRVGWTPQNSLLGGLEKTVRYFEQNIEHYISKDAAPS